VRGGGNKRFALHANAGAAGGKVPGKEWLIAMYKNDEGVGDSGDAGACWSEGGGKKSCIRDSAVMVTVYECQGGTGLSAFRSWERMVGQKRGSPTGGS